MYDAFFLWWTFLDNFTKVHLKHKGSIFLKLSAHGESIKQTRDIIIKNEKESLLWLYRLFFISTSICV